MIGKRTIPMAAEVGQIKGCVGIRCQHKPHYWFVSLGRNIWRGGEYRAKKNTGRGWIDTRRVERRRTTKCGPVQVYSSAQLESRVVILGGGGRVGSQTAKALIKLHTETNGGTEFTSQRLQIVLAGRNEARVTSVLENSPELSAHARFGRCDIDDTNMDSLEKIIGGASLVINAAGPFQRRKHHHPLQAAIKVNS